MRSISFIVPVYNEEESLKELHRRIVENLFGLNAEYSSSYEIIFVDDGSTDSSWKVIEGICNSNKLTTKGIKLNFNQGKAAALKRGFEQARGDIIFTLDADLQDDPKEIHRFIEKLDEGYDLVSGWKKIRHDPWHKVLPSRVFNKMLSKLLNVELHDHNCGFKCYKKEVAKSLNPYGEMHRMLPSIASVHGYKSAEIVVEHHPRVFGYSKYGVKRFLRGFMDMLTVYFLKNYKDRPLHFFGGSSLVFLLTGILAHITGLSLVQSLPSLSSIFSNLGSSLILVTVPVFSVGLIAELLLYSTKQEEDFSEKRLEFSNFRPQAKVLPIQTKQKKKALVVDDDSNIRKLISYKLKKMGFEVIEAGDGKEALELINSEISLVVLDIMLPEISGIECLEELKNHNSNTEILMVSAQGQVEQAVKAIKLGASDYLSKPFDPSEFESAVNNLVNLH